MRVRYEALQTGTSGSSRRGVAIQALLVLSIGLIALAPPPSGLMLLVPLAPGSAAELDAVAGAAGATLAAPGPLPGSRYVDGDRAALLPQALRRGILLLSGAPRLCAPPSGVDQ